MSPKATTIQTTEVKLTPTLKRKVLTELRTFAALHEQIRPLKAAMQQRKDKVQKLFEDAGEFGALTQGVSLDGFKTKYIASVRGILDKKILIGLGVSEEMLAEATVTKPSKPYLKITPPGEKEEEE